MLIILYPLICFQQNRNFQLYWCQRSQCLYFYVFLQFNSRCLVPSSPDLLTVTHLLHYGPQDHILVLKFFFLTAPLSKDFAPTTYSKLTKMCTWWIFFFFFSKWHSSPMKNDITAAGETVKKEKKRMGSKSLTGPKKISILKF